MQYVFEYEDHSVIRTVEIDGEVWFYGVDVCNALEIKNPSDAYSRLDRDDLGQTEAVDKRGQKQTFRIVNEPGLYTLILRSDKPEAKRFKRWITHEVIPQIRHTGFYSRRGTLPHAFVRRFNDNWHRVDRGHFSVISELYIRLYGRFEQVGYVLAEKAKDGREIRPDVSVGIRFSKWLKAKRPAKADAFKMYMHLFQNGLEFEARQYENALLPDFIEFLDSEWIPNCAEDYLRPRDPAALAHLPRLLGGNVRRPLRPPLAFPKPLPKRSA